MQRPHQYSCRDRRLPLAQQSPGPDAKDAQPSLYTSLKNGCTYNRKQLFSVLTIVYKKNAEIAQNPGKHATSAFSCWCTKTAGLALANPRIRPLCHLSKSLWRNDFRFFMIPMHRQRAHCLRKRHLLCLSPANVKDPDLMPKNDIEKDSTKTGGHKPPRPEKPTPKFPLFPPTERPVGESTLARAHGIIQVSQ